MVGASRQLSLKLGDGLEPGIESAEAAAIPELPNA
jgi:hypothetical protein